MAAMGDGGALFEFFKERARECILWRMSPEYWDSLRPLEHAAWLEAWKELQEEANQSN